MTVSIVPLDRDNEPALLGLWRAYQEFYRTSGIDAAKNQAHVQRIRDAPALGRIHLAVDGATAIGFSTVYFTFTSTRVCEVAVLNDLFVTPERRGAGVGRALIEHAFALARSEGIRFVRWLTEASNTSAQQLYRHYGEPTSWKLYSVDVTARP
jgi:GNAT superfamily N-acetyltransferase